MVRIFSWTKVPSGTREMLISLLSNMGLCLGGRHKRAFSWRSICKLDVLVSSLCFWSRKYSSDQTRPVNCWRCSGGACSKNLVMNSC